MAIYLSTALTTIGIVKLFADVFDLPHGIFPVVVTIFTCGAISAFAAAWYHGAGGKQKPKKREFALHAVVLGAAIFFSLRVSDTVRVVSRVPDERSVAVLPFTNLSDSKEDAYFSDGIMEDILTQLSKIHELRVISRTSVMKFRDSKKTIREIGRELGVASILEGSVRRYGTRVRIDGRLINSATDEQIWGETYEREIKDIFAIQSEVARNIANVVGPVPSP